MPLRPHLANRIRFYNIRALIAEVVKLVDTLDLGSSAARCESSSLSFRTSIQQQLIHREQTMPGLLILLVFLLLGGVLQQLFSLPVPASIIGMLLLLLALIVRGQTPDALQKITQTLSPLLPLFLIPVSVGIVTQKHLLEAHATELLVILAVSIIPGALVSAWIMSRGKSG